MRSQGNDFSMAPDTVIRCSETFVGKSL